MAASESRIGPYRILRLINRGGQGSVYLGFDQRLERRVAIKIYNLPDDRATRRRCLNEAQLLAGIHHPKVVQIHDLIESRDHLAIIMEYVPGCDLQEYLCAVRPSLASVVIVGTDMAGAIAVARQQRIVHRDLKASNVLVTAQGRAKLSDFGIARGDGPGAGADFAGSWSALSPEQYRGEPLDVRSDLFALGCLLYRMLTGIHPFFRDGGLLPEGLFQQSAAPVRERASPDIELPPEMADLVDAMVQLDARNRPDNTHQVRRVLRQVSRQLPMAASNSLLEEAQACFREESSDDIPPSIPRELVRGGRSRLVAGGGFKRASWLDWLPVTRPARAAAVLVPVLLLGLVFAQSSPGRATPIWVEKIVVDIHTDAVLPPELSGEWLVDETLRVIAENLGPVELYGPGAPADYNTTYHVGGRKPETDEQLQLALRCTPAICLYQVSRYVGDGVKHAQALLTSGTPISRWREILRQKVAENYH